ncbi:hypothetical protein M758_8G141800 [Ceratodon purpureus]|uniref:Secreted protein n=1 Tax=Ceratodon purpureus TaxID=3225 RepID=A0A8T0H258_CERPU|nr:hypothetical protein KC19_8G145500 [Ceratodon purpureus]KAG0608901.1 hypothetical protein M758_8G141800 [Ceratodon purpureus]
MTIVPALSLLTLAIMTTRVCCPGKHSSQYRTSCRNSLSRSDTPTSKTMLGQSDSLFLDLGLKESSASFILRRAVNRAYFKPIIE